MYELDFFRLRFVLILRCHYCPESDFWLFQGLEKVLLARIILIILAHFYIKVGAYDVLCILDYSEGLAP